MQINSATLNALRVKFSGIYSKAYDLTPNWYDKVSITVPSDGHAGVYGWMASLPSMREWLGERQIANLHEYDYVLPNRRFELTYGVNRDHMKDDLLGTYATAFANLGRQTKKHPDELVRDAMRNGQSSKVLFTGAPYFSTSHYIDPTNPGLGTYSNYSASGMALTPANYEAVRAIMQNYKGENGLPLGIMPNLLVVPPHLEPAAKRILKMELIPNAAGTATESNPNVGTADYVVAPDLGVDTTTWYLMDTSRGLMPFIYQLREATEFAMITGANDIPVFKENQYWFGSTIRDNVGYTLPFLCYKAVA